MLESRLRHGDLARLVDADDIWQTVMVRFFQRARAGLFELENPEQMLHLLRTMASNALRDEARWVHRERRDVARQLTGTDRALEGFADHLATPAEAAETHDLAEHILHQMQRKEREVVVGWAEGKDWEELAREAGDTPETMRKRFNRAIARVSRHLNGQLASVR
jgi:DNA-directed RNA polymerase specialized sigma24 family protein